MSLPVFNSTNYTVELPISKKKIIYRPYNIEEEKALLLAKESENVLDLLECMFNITDKCVIDPSSFDSKTLNWIDFTKLIMLIRSKSISEKISLSFPCPHCETSISYENKLDNLFIIENIGISKKDVEMGNGFSFSIVVPNIQYITSIEKSDNNIDKMKDTLMYSIDKIWHDGKMYPVEDIEELRTKIINNLSYSDIVKIFANIKDMATASFVINTKCTNEDCGKDINIEQENVLNFFA
ncbi:hypothetical protein [uncultured Arcobacter sp.]|uniref:T4 family baseplate hub assembly chaperone n=1 Tax=uncultured Arcobacter sp. TaxID=165434 RepID=UPI00262DDD8D|nr:hypothetical protein [uncultured Arcobacter sp.]